MIFHTFAYLIGYFFGSW